MLESYSVTIDHSHHKRPLITESVKVEKVTSHNIFQHSRPTIYVEPKRKQKLRLSRESSPISHKISITTFLSLALTSVGKARLEQGGKVRC